MEDKNTISIHNIKSNQFRQSHTDGASAGITPSGHININFYSQRNAIPKETVFELNEDGTLGPLKNVSKDSKNGIIREYDFGIHVDIDTCIGIKNLLEQKIREYERIIKEE
jgi:hypothetical protein